MKIDRVMIAVVVALEPRQSGAFPLPRGEVLASLFSSKQHRLGVTKINCRAPAIIAECIFYQLVWFDNESLDHETFGL